MRNNLRSLSMRDEEEKGPLSSSSSDLAEARCLVGLTFLLRVPDSIL